MGTTAQCRRFHVRRGFLPRGSSRNAYRIGNGEEARRARVRKLALAK